MRLLDLSRAWLLLLASFLAPGATGHARSPEPLPIADLFRAPLLRDVSISPEGRWISAVHVDDDDNGSVVLIDPATGRLTGVRGGDGRDVFDAFWQRGDRLLFRLSRDKIYSLGLFATSPDRLTRQRSISLYDAIDVVGRPRSRPDRLIAWIVRSALDEGQRGGLHELSLNRSVSVETAGDLRDSVVATYPQPRGAVHGYQSDFDGELGLGFTNENGDVVAHLWQPDLRAWRRLDLDLEEVKIVCFDPDRRYLWVVTHDPAAGSQLRRLALADLSLEEPVLTDADYDLAESWLIFSHVDRALAGVRYSRHRLVHRWFSPRFAEVHATVSASLPANADHRIVDFDDEEKRFVVASEGPATPRQYFLFEVGSPQLLRLGHTAPELKDLPLQTSTPVKFTARDGLKLEGYVTLPPGASRERPVPLIVLAHGGPWVRDTFSYDPEVQFLVSRGYAVLQPNYRGSSGYAPSISREPAFEFGAMRDDVVDATRAFLASGYVDPRRVSIMGASFGGYLALACAASEPELYRAAISLCGVFDWAAHVKSKRDERQARPGEYEWLVAELGDPRRSQERYDAISVFNQLDRVRAAVFLAHGREDSIVSVAQTRRLARELRKRDVVHETFYRPLGGHGFYAYADRVDYYAALERFLEKHVPVTPAPAAAAAVNAQSSEASP